MAITPETRQPNYIKYATDDSRVGKLAEADGYGRAGSLQNCGDLLEVFLEITDHTVRAARYRATGCPGALASAAAVAELAEGLTLHDAARIGEKAVLDRLEDLPAEKHECSNLGALALSRALEDYVSSERWAAMPLEKNCVAVAMSGGVDSSTTASLLRKEGRQVLGLSMRLHDEDGFASKSCCSSRDLRDAASVARQLDIAHYTIDLRDSFAKEVVERFCQAYLSGRTPNPCVDCNRYIKFSSLRRVARRLGAPRIATGHYVRIEFDPIADRWLVRRATDMSKDQSYMFWCAGQDTLAATLTPLGALAKSQVRDIAEGHGLPVAAKQESQEICFVPNNDYRTFLVDKAGYKPAAGPIVDRAGNRLGSHHGLAGFTVGQRRGVGIPGMSRRYVLAIDSRANRLVVGPRHELATTRVVVTEVNWVGVARLQGSMNASAMYRYNTAPAPVTVNADGESRVIVEFKPAVNAVAPGQSIVFYEGDTLLGGGVCESTDVSWSEC